MKIRVRFHTTLFFAALLVLEQASSTAGPATLSVEQTIASTYLPVLPDGVRQRANPEARSAIVQMFDGAVESGNEPSPGVLALFGYLGIGEDAGRLRGYIEQQRGQQRPHAGVFNAMLGLGRMAYRGVVPAKEVLAIMAQKPYWEDLAIRTMPDWLYETYPDLISVNAVFAQYMLDSIDRNPLPSDEEMLLRFYPAYAGDDDARKRFIYQIAIARKGAGNIADAQESTAANELNSETRKQLDWAYETFHLGKAPGGAADAPRDTPDRAPETAEEMMVSVVRPDTPAPPDEKARFAALADEARDAFVSFVAARVENGDYDAFKGRLLDDGRPQVPRLVEKHWADIRRELQDTQAPIFRAMQTGGLTPDAGQFTAGQAEDGSYIVTMPIPNSGALVAEHWKAAGQEAQLLAEGFAISDSLELVLVMRKIGDVWYWNPFGW
ncbi:MAG: hypothetical protein KF886_22420 [Candidatus Hydrogenedentes bacterium]|nr:hypothetical protein [Candidatus Hydrogenedentota bacterium]